MDFYISIDGGKWAQHQMLNLTYSFLVIWLRERERVREKKTPIRTVLMYENVSLMTKKLKKEKEKK